MSAMNDGWPQDFEALSRQYWNAWSEMARQASSGQHQQVPGFQQVPGWQDAMDMWAPWARDGRAQTDDVLARMNAQTGAWFGRMQELAKQFSGGSAGASDIASEWKKALGIENNFGNPFGDMFQQMSGNGANSMDQWMQQVTPWLEGMRNEARGMFNMPAFGLQREQQERWQALGKTMMDYRQAMSGYNAQLMECGKRAFAKFEDKLAERSEPGRQLDSTRALFDLWIDAAEESWGEVAMTPEFRTAYGQLVNAQSRMRAGVNGEVERAAGQFGMPTRTEVNSSHKKVTQLERDLRGLKQRLSELEAVVGASATAVRAKSESAAKPAVAEKMVAEKGQAKQAPAAKKPAVKTTKTVPASRRAKK